jgi:hypothetical protein
MTSRLPAAQTAEARAIARAIFRKKILLPFVIGLVAILALTAIAVLSPRSDVTANVLMIVLMLCPAFICLFPLYILMVAGIYGMARAQGMVHKPLERATQLTAAARDKTQSTSDQVTRSTVNWSSKIAPIEQAMKKAFDTPDWLKDKDHDDSTDRK